MIRKDHSGRILLNHLLKSLLSVSDPAVNMVLKLHLFSLFTVVDGGFSAHAVLKTFRFEGMGFVDQTEQTNYINTVLCLQSKRFRLDFTMYPSEKSRFDDFTAAHINMKILIHVSGIFLS